LSHDPAKTHASFEDPNLVSRAGLVPVMALAQRCGLADLAGEHVTIARPVLQSGFVTQTDPGVPGAAIRDGHRMIMLL
jgi:hypothetical protein